MDKPPIKQLDRAYSLLFVFILSALLLTQSVALSISNDKDGLKFSLSFKDLNPVYFYGYVITIGGILGLPTDKVAITIAKILSKKLDE